MNKKTIVFGASAKPERYAYLAVQKLKEKGHEVLAFGNKEGEVFGVNIDTKPANYKEIHTVTLYLSPENQKQYYQYIISLKPKRVIFNPGTENTEFYQILKAAGIPYEASCTLVLLSTNQY